MFKKQHSTFFSLLTYDSHDYDERFTINSSSLTHYLCLHSTTSAIEPLHPPLIPTIFTLLHIRKNITRVRKEGNIMERAMSSNPVKQYIFQHKRTTGESLEKFARLQPLRGNHNQLQTTTSYNKRHPNYTQTTSKVEAKHKQIAPNNEN